MPKQRFYFWSFLFLCSLPGTLRAQVSVWQGGKAKMEDLKQKKSRQESRFRQWKAYVRKQASDSNYTYALSVGGRLYTDGWSGGLYFGKRKSAGKQVLWQLHFSEVKHEKETRQENTGSFRHIPKGRPYIFGKVNNVYVLQLGYGRQQMLLPALLDGNLSVAVRYAAGPALALLKPYYLDLVYVSYTPEQVIRLQTEKYSAANADHFLNPAYIRGAAQWGKGLGETRVIPGIFGELAFVLEPDKPASFIKTITIGGNAGLYASPLKIMADRKAYRYEAACFIGLAIGGRWR